MYDLTEFTIKDMSQCGATLSDLAKTSTTIEEMAQLMVEHLYENMVDPMTGKSACALVRFYKTHPYNDLDEELQAFARNILGGEPAIATTKCLTLLGTAGDKPEWNNRGASSGHKAIPLANKEFVDKIPMISRLIGQFGLDIENVIEPDPNLLLELEKKDYNVFYVPNALGSKYIPAQEDFVIPHQIKSVVGFGGMLPSRNLFAIIMFAKIPIPADTANLLKGLAVTVKNVANRFDRGAVFAASAKKSIARQIFSLGSTATDAQRKKSHSPRHRVSLKAKATFLAIAISTLPVVAIGGIAYYLANNAVQQKILEAQKIQAVAVSRDLAQFAEDRYVGIQNLARTPMLTNSKLWETITTQEKKKFLEKFLEKGIDSIAIIEAETGDLALSVGSKTIENFKDIDFYEAVVKTNGPVIVPLRTSKTTFLSSFFVAAPVFDSNTGKLLYVISSRTPASYIDELMGRKIDDLAQQIGQKTNPKYLVADNKGLVFVSEDTQEIEFPIEEFFPAATKLSESGKTNTTIDISPVDGKEYLLVYAPLPKVQGLPELNWSTILATEKGIAFSFQGEILLTIIIGTIVIALIVGIIAVILANRALRPILDAANALEKIGQGELDTYITVEGEDELAKLGSNVNLMAEKIQKLLGEQQQAAEQQMAVQTEIAEQQRQQKKCFSAN